MAVQRYAGIRFPDRAEALDDFSGYRVFLDPWEPIADQLRGLWESLSLRGESSILAIHGQQGAGKTLFTRKLTRDFEETRKVTGLLTPDPNNIWHRLTGGKQLDPSLIQEATAKTSLSEIENKKEWVTEAAATLKGQRGRAVVLLADNAERAYFRQGLVEMSDMEFIQHRDSPELIRLAAQRLVAHVREDLRGSVLVLLSNDDLFLLALEEEVEKQHGGLMSLTQLKLPDARTKETVIRVNTNRLNSVTYWSSIDQGANEDRVALKLALEGDKNFPDSFRAVDTASRNRTGRPARRNVITLVCLVNAEESSSFPASELADVKRTEVDHGWMSLHLFEGGWTPKDMDEREATLLESEWVLRICALGNPFVRSLLSVDAEAPGADHREQVVALLNRLTEFQGPGTKTTAREAYTHDFEQLVDSWTSSDRDLSPFWSAGQPRSTEYEAALGSVLTGYNTRSEGFLTYRPDYIVHPFRPCAVSDAVGDTNDAIRAAIRRQAHVFEFTALAQPSLDGVQTYLRTKLPNYVEVTQEQ
ncbi:hypothetical protein LFM56_12990 [Cellulomonas iranensis]|uniref:hypothetical protein n=1 Tax=Cellulomonas iranensis TaxID=76862 RepID=UPI001CF586A0|nr:hypothetical protein [Cellulomonas iranensis]UCN13808.1 hypothetical protein LFM56_12990 [Cellulomonas iranensis]